MDRWVRPWGRAKSRGMALAACVIAVGIAGGIASSPARADGPQRHVSVQALAKRLTQWVTAPDKASHEKAAARVTQGVPPDAMIAFLAAARKHHDALYVPVYERASRYRNAIVRGQALAALAALGPKKAEHAIVVAAGDHERDVRRLAWALSRRHPSPRAHEVVAAMLERDEELAAEVAEFEAEEAERKRIAEAEAEEAEIIVFDEETDGQGEEAPPPAAEKPASASRPSATTRLP